MPSSTPMFGVTWNLMRCFSAVSRRLLPEPSSRARMSCGAPGHLLHPRQHDLQHRCTLHLERQYLVLVPGAPWTPGTRSFPAVLHLSHESKESSIRHLERQYLVLVPGAPWTPGTRSFPAVLHLSKHSAPRAPVSCACPWCPLDAFPAVLHLSHESKESSIRHLERQYLVLVPGAPWTPGTRSFRAAP